MVSERGQSGVSMLVPAGILVVIAAIVFGLGGTILDDIQADQTADSVAYNATNEGLSGIATLSGWLPTIALVIAAAIVIGVVVQFLGRRM
jgi:hypothetical protein